MEKLVYSRQLFVSVFSEREKRVDPETVVSDKSFSFRSNKTI